MHLVFYGSEASGQLTINCDGDRVVLKRSEEGWVPSSDAMLSIIREKIARDVPILGVIIGGGKSPSSPPTNGNGLEVVK